MKVFTICGKPVMNKEGVYQKAKYIFENEEHEEVNMLPLLAKAYKDNEFVPIYTKSVKDDVQNMVKSQNLQINFDDRFMIEDEKNFESIFAILNEAVKGEDKFVFDVTHGFRHLPLLVLVRLLIENFRDTTKVEHIWFAKEIDQYKKYEVIDLKKYLELANIAFVITAFANNYTVANSVSVSGFDGLIKAMKQFTSSMLALDIYALKNDTDELLSEIDKIKEESVKNLLETLREEMEKVGEILKEESNCEKLLDISCLLVEKGYLLNSLNLLFEALRWFLEEVLSHEDDNFVVSKGNKEHYDSVTKWFNWINDEKLKISNFDMLKIYISDSVNKTKRFDSMNPKKKNQDTNFQELKTLYNEIKNVRNNCSHGRIFAEASEINNEKLKGWQNRFENLINACLKNKTQTKGGVK